MITINGIERQLKFNIFGIERMQDKNEDKSSIASVYAMVWGGLEGNRYAKEQDRDYTFENIVDAIDEMSNEARISLATSATTLFLESQAYKTLVSDDAKVDDVTVEEKKSEDIPT